VFLTMPQLFDLMVESGASDVHITVGRPPVLRVHGRLKSEIRDLADLRGAVARWAPQTKHRFTPEEIEDVVQYLNATHYRLGSAPARELIYGAELMSAKEREQYRRQAAAARDEAARSQLREQHRRRIRERARERGVRLAEPAGIVAR